MNHKGCVLYQDLISTYERSSVLLLSTALHGAWQHSTGGEGAAKII